MNEYSGTMEYYYTEREYLICYIMQKEMLLKIFELLRNRVCPGKYLGMIGEKMHLILTRISLQSSMEADVLFIAFMV